MSDAHNAGPALLSFCGTVWIFGTGFKLRSFSCGISSAERNACSSWLISSVSLLWVRNTSSVNANGERLTYLLVGTRLKLASNRQSRSFDLHREHDPFNVFRASQATLAWRQRVQLFARPKGLALSELILFMSSSESSTQITRTVHWNWQLAFEGFQHWGFFDSRICGKGCNQSVEVHKYMKGLDKAITWLLRYIFKKQYLC